MSSQPRPEARENQGSDRGCRALVCPTHTVYPAQLINRRTDEAMKAVSYLTEAVLDPVSGHVNDIHDLAFNRAFGTKDNVWEFFGRSEQARRRSRFDLAMEGSKNTSPALAIVEGWWDSIVNDQQCIISSRDGLDCPWPRCSCRRRRGWRGLSIPHATQKVRKPQIHCSRSARDY